MGVQDGSKQVQQDRGGLTPQTTGMKQREPTGDDGGLWSLKDHLQGHTYSYKATPPKPTQMAWPTED